MQETNIEIDKNDKIHDLIWHKLYHINVDSFTTNKLPMQCQINIYTDGSKTDKHVGAGYSILRGNYPMLEWSERLSNESTVFHAELYAIIKAMTDILGILTLEDRYIKLLSDSRSAIQALIAAQLTPN